MLLETTVTHCTTPIVSDRSDNVDLFGAVLSPPSRFGENRETIGAALPSLDDE